jgi:DNA-binding beta-propeller fold protein YncE
MSQTIHFATSHTLRSSARQVAGILGAGLLILLSGCATQPSGDSEENIKLVWPAPPLPKRIAFVRSIYGEKDINEDNTFKPDLVDFLSGKKPPENRITEPMGIAVSDDGERLFVSDFVQLAVYEFDFGKKKFTKINKDKQLERPAGIALDADENIYVVESDKKGIDVMDKEGKELRFITDPSISRPIGIAIDRKRKKIYLCDTAHNKDPEHTVKIFDLQGKLLGAIGKGKGSELGQFLFPTFVSVDPAGNVYVTDTINSRIQKFDPDGKYLTKYGERGNGWGMFDKPKGSALDSFGNLYAVDSGWSNVQIFNDKQQILLFFGGRGSIPGLLGNPTAIAIDKNNRIYVGDSLNHRIEVYDLTNTTAEDSFLTPPAVAPVKKSTKPTPGKAPGA